MDFPKSLDFRNLFFGIITHRLKFLYNNVRVPYYKY